jgi:DNA topoisomerase-3
MQVVLTEKPSVARDIAAHLGAKQRRDGYYEGNGYQITWAFGHLITLKEPEDYDPHLKKWSLATLPFIPKSFELKVADDSGVRKQFAVIQKLLRAATTIVCATDAGREGELIFRYILHMAQCSHKSWHRLWLSSLTEEALQAAFKNLKPGNLYDNLYAAARCRSESDWIVGLNATRNFTVRYGQGKTLWSVGRVQTPVLAMITKRDDEIRHFKVEPFWELFTKYRDVAFKLKAERFKTKDLAEQALQKIQNSTFTITGLESKREKEHPPLLYDLTELQREMNRKQGLSAADTLQMAQTLYEQKLITYPRTDSRYLTKDLQPQVATTLKQLKNLRPQEIEALDLDKLPFSNRIVNDKKVNDHHAILPTGKQPRDLSPQLQAIYNAIFIRLIAVFYPTCIREVTTVEGSANSLPFQAKGTRVVTAGWTALYPKKSAENQDSKAAQETQSLPKFTKGEEGTHEPYLTEGKTKPPSHYNENALLGAMETAGKLVEEGALREALKEKGIGTPATRAAIIETLIKRKYIQRNGKSLVATDLGRYLIALIQDPNLKSPELTGEWEAKLKAIEQGKFSASTFMQEIGTFTEYVIRNSDIYRVDESVYGCCPKCKHPVIKGKKGYGCSQWKEGCSFVLWPTYKERHLNDFQVRVLLQKHLLLPPIEGCILSLSDNGEITEIPVPATEGNRFTNSATAKKSSRSK